MIVNFSKILASSSRLHSLIMICSFQKLFQSPLAEKEVKEIGSFGKVSVIYGVIELLIDHLQIHVYTLKGTLLSHI